MQSFFSHGKLLLSGEYLVLDGAESFALATKFGQKLTVQNIEDKKESQYSTLKWLSKDANDELWFEAHFDIQTLAILESTDQKAAEKLRSILSKAKVLNPQFLISNYSFLITTQTDFPLNWGLGTSSTLICNIAKWSETNAFELSKASFGGSGVDIAVGMVGSELLYSLPPAWDSFVWRPGFEEHLFFVHLGQKQNSRDAIANYREKKVDPAQIERISAISRSLATCSDLAEFEALITEHEEIISSVLEIPTVKQDRFPDYPYAIKSLGAWGGDFILAVGKDESESYFKERGYSTVLAYKDIIKQ